MPSSESIFKSLVSRIVQTDDPSDFITVDYFMNRMTKHKLIKPHTSEDDCWRYMDAILGAKGIDRSKIKEGRVYGYRIDSTKTSGTRLSPNLSSPRVVQEEVKVKSVMNEEVIKIHSELEEERRKVEQLVSSMNKLKLKCGMLEDEKRSRDDELNKLRGELGKLRQERGIEKDGYDPNRHLRRENESLKKDLAERYKLEGISIVLESEDEKEWIVGMRDIIKKGKFPLILPCDDEDQAISIVKKHEMKIKK